MDPKICPYLGLIDDLNNHKVFPYEGNHCYRAKKPTAVALRYQRGYCLADEHTACAGYINGWVNGFPDALKALPPVYKRYLRNKWVWAALAVVLLVSIYFVFPQQINAMGANLRSAVNSRFTQPTSSAAVLFTSTPSKTPVPPTRTASPAPSATATSTPAFTETPSPTVTPTITKTPNQASSEFPYMVEVITTALNIRNEPIYMANGANIVERLVQGEIVEVLDEQKGWLLTERGWIFKAYTRKVSE
ncbi:MAG: hypothetical protein SCH68_11835 [Brevefilum sp.]|nr:hypothetical protein [Brevefilum sp.]